jgi:hypothetical protein
VTYLCSIYTLHGGHRTRELICHWAKYSGDLSVAQANHSTSQTAESVTEAVVRSVRHPFSRSKARQQFLPCGNRPGIKDHGALAASTFVTLTDSHPFVPVEHSLKSNALLSFTPCSSEGIYETCDRETEHLHISLIVGMFQLELGSEAFELFPS